MFPTTNTILLLSQPPLSGNTYLLSDEPIPLKHHLTLWRQSLLGISFLNFHLFAAIGASSFFRYQFFFVMEAGLATA